MLIMPLRQAQTASSLGAQNPPSAISPRVSDGKEHTEAMLETQAVFQLAMFWLKADAEANICKQAASTATTPHKQSTLRKQDIPTERTDANGVPWAKHLVQAAPHHARKHGGQARTTEKKICLGRTFEWLQHVRLSSSNTNPIQP